MFRNLFTAAKLFEKKFMVLIFHILPTNRTNKRLNLVEKTCSQKS